MSEVTDIRPVSRGTRARRVYLDGTEWRLVPAEVVSDVGLRTGQEWRLEDLAARISESEPGQAWARAVRLLEFRERGTGELRQRLSADAYDPDVVEQVIERISSGGLVDDERFAEGIVRAAARKRYGRARIAAQLATKGVDDDLAAAVLARCCDGDAELERAVEAARTLVRRGPSALPRVASRLVARGFSSSVAWDAARKVTMGVEAPSDDL